MYGELLFPITRDVISDWNAMTAMWEHIFTSSMQIDEIFNHPLIITEPPGNPNKVRERILMVCILSLFIHNYHHIHSSNYDSY